MALKSNKQYFRVTFTQPTRINLIFFVITRQITIEQANFPNFWQSSLNSFKKEKILALTTNSFPQNFLGKSHLLMKYRENVESSFCELMKSFGEPSDWKTKTSFFSGSVLRD
jgi:hypothetical protein